MKEIGVVGKQWGGEIKQLTDVIQLNTHIIIIIIITVPIYSWHEYFFAEY